MRDVLIAGSRHKAFVYFLHETQYHTLGANDAWARASYHSTYLIDQPVAARSA